MQPPQRILLVDQHRPRRRRLAAVLARAGYRVIESPGPAAAAVQKKIIPDALVVNIDADAGGVGFLKRFLESPRRAPAAHPATAL